MSSLPGAAGDLPLVMFPVAPVLLAGGPQSSPWQVAFVRVDETPAGDSSERENPGVTQSRHWPIDIYALPDCLPHTVVEGGPAGPEVIEPLALLVRDHADPAAQHAVMRNTIVEGGPVGPEVIEPLELLVLDHADPGGQHAVIRDTTRLLGHPLLSDIVNSKLQSIIVSPVQVMLNTADIQCYNNSLVSHREMHCMLLNRRIFMLR